MSKITVQKNIQLLAKQALSEANYLFQNNIVSDEFILSAISDLKDLSSSDQVSDEIYKRSKFLGRASVRVYQSFDEIPETDRFVELCNNLSKAIANGF